ncbi:MAG: cation transporter [Proteobacteria bacterium]|nr:cation transporter [Pseudomonadota bacterium]
MRRFVKFFILLAIFLVLLESYFTYANQATDEEELTITVIGMRCVGCEFGVEREVKKLKGVISVKADSSRNIVTVRFKKNVIKIDTIIEKIIELGYRVEKPPK